MNSDARERQEALDPSRSFIVEAPAGSGKTTLLVDRFLKLLTKAERPEAVVAMTFTRKAAAEMRDRVLKNLKESGDDRWNLLEDPSRLQIQTIDSLCSLLTRRMPVVSHLGGSPKVRETPDELYRLAARRTIAELAEGNDEERGIFRHVALHFDNNLASLEKQIAKMLSKREQWRRLSRNPPPDVQEFCQVLTHAERSVRTVFREAGEVDFTEITRAAIEALGGEESPSDLLYWLDYRIEHLLVDEFQDTSLSQYELIEALTGQWSDGDGRTLFLVGDPMQSIYRFREAEVGFFLRCREERALGSVRLHPLQLRSNFRSTPEIVTWSQATFEPILDRDDVQQGSVKLRPAEAARGATGIQPQLFPFVDDNGDKEAEQVVALAKKSSKLGDVAILVRGRNHLLRILPALRDAGVRYEAFEIDRLCEEQHILDLISLTRAVLHVGDRLAWLACLRAPWCGLTLNELALIAEHDEGKTVLERLTLVPRAARTGEILANAVEKVGRMSLRDLVERTWMALGGPAVLAEDSYLEDAQTYFDLIEEFEQGGIIRDFSLLRERMEFLFAKPVSGPDCVKVMTIHGAKGLEFDTVIIPQLGRGTNQRDRDLLIWTERPDALVAAVQPQKKGSNELYTQIQQELDVKELNELKRLFYVAVTRAKDRLYLLGCVGTKQNRAALKEASSGTFLKFLWPGVKPEFESERRRRQPEQQGFPPEKVNLVRRLPATWQLPRFEPSVHWETELRRATASASKVSYEWVSGTGRHVGTVVHEALKRMAAEGIWSPNRIEKTHGLFASELERLGVGEDELVEATARVARALRNTVSSERGRWILDRHAQARSEWAIGGRIRDHLVSGTVDRTFRDSEGRRWIIDYKTSDHEGANLQGFLDTQQDEYRAQLENYATLVARMMPDPIHLGLYFPLLDAWREWQFAEEAASYTGS